MTLSLHHGDLQGPPRRDQVPWLLRGGDTQDSLRRPGFTGLTQCGRDVLSGCFRLPGKLGPCTRRPHPPRMWSWGSGVGVRMGTEAVPPVDPAGDRRRGHRSLGPTAALRFCRFVTFQRGVRRPAEIQAVTQASSPSPGQTGFADTEVVLFDTEFYDLFVNSGG